MLHTPPRTTTTAHDVFPELATTLFHYIQKLLATLVEQGVEQVYFLSREGQPLLRMFNRYRDTVGARIKSHYLEVSRRSTLLPSLSPLADETFVNLFRQYRRISLLEFLSSLGLEAQASGITKALALPDVAVRTREEDFPTSPIFTSLKALPIFQELYESERLARRRAFIAYITRLSGGFLPGRLVLVDVGWKGTIQDNLFSMLCRKGDTPVAAVTGYYIGLVAAGAAGPQNEKVGVLFSSVGQRSPQFHVFNENRALFEVMLAADHGSIVTYETNTDGHSHAIRGAFEEGEMIRSVILPAQRHLFNQFEQLAAKHASSNDNLRPSFDEVVRAHGRMVFRPTPRELAWFSSVFHVENYGVFERSRFAQADPPYGWMQRLHFLLQLTRRRNIDALGFWPWAAIHTRGGAIPAAVYGLIRRLQR